MSPSDWVPIRPSLNPYVTVTVDEPEGTLADDADTHTEGKASVTVHTPVNADVRHSTVRGVELTVARVASGTAII
jgi:hypothetical protein